MEYIAVRIWLRSVLLLIAGGAIFFLIKEGCAFQWGDILFMSITCTCLALFFALPHLVLLYCFLWLSRRFMIGTVKTMTVFVSGAVIAGVGGTSVYVLLLPGAREGLFTPSDWPFLLACYGLTIAPALLATLSHRRLVAGCSNESFNQINTR